MIIIDGFLGEGGGQILRTSLALSLVTGQPFRIENIRTGRKKPGLMRQHLTAVNAAVEVGQAEVKGNAIGSLSLSFAPQTVKSGQYHFAISTAGSCTLVMQTVLPALLTAEGPSELILEGGTHNPYAPPFDFLEQAFLPLVNRMGPTVEAVLERPGFYPAGGGRFTVSIQPAKELAQLELLERGELVKRRARAMVAQIPRNVADRELKVVQENLSWNRDELALDEVKNSRGPGNVLTLTIASEQVTEVFTGFGERGVMAENVARSAVKAAREYLASPAPVGRYLADQLLLLLALAGGGKFRTLPPTRHTSTNIEVIQRFLELKVSVIKHERNVWEIIISK